MNKANFGDPVGDTYCATDNFLHLLFMSHWFRVIERKIQIPKKV